MEELTVSPALNRRGSDFDVPHAVFASDKAVAAGVGLDKDGNFTRLGRWHNAFILSCRQLSCRYDTLTLVLSPLAGES